MRKKGFTVIEMTVVITIILLIAAMAIPSVVNLMKSRALKDGSRIVRMGFLQAKFEAQSRGRPVLVRFVPFQKSVAGQDTSGNVKTTPVLLWKMQLIDSDGDGDYVTDENLDTYDFARWGPPFPSMDDNPNLGLPPPGDPVNELVVKIRDPGHTHALLNPLDPEDDALIDSFTLPEQVVPRPGSNWAGALNAVFIFNANGSCQIRRPGLTVSIPNVRTGRVNDAGSFRDDAVANHDFKVQDLSGEAVYFDIVGPTGVVNIYEPP